ncbi:MAG: tandem-95 repeat protein [Anaerolineales bacterium]|nr:tandem-95 repeat protein [Anaerolineales bacterium]
MNSRTPIALTLRRLLALSLLVLSGLLALRWQTARAAAVIEVNTSLDKLADDGRCSLREAVIAANRDARSGSRQGECPAGSGPDVIRIPAGLGPLVLTRTDKGNEDAAATGDLDLLGDLTIEAVGSGVVVRGGGSFTDRIFQAHSGQVTIRGLTIAGGAARGEGGAIHNRAVLVVEDATLSGSRAKGHGGGIYNAPGAALALTNVTLSANTSQASGGGLYNLGAADLNNVTLSANSAALGGGLAAQGGALSLWNSIAAGNLAASGPDCAGALASAGYSLIGAGPGCALPAGAPGLLSGSAGLEPLQNNGGPSLTHALLPGSAAIDAGSPAMPGSGGQACAPADQRGALRPRGPRCDMGAYEAGQPNSALVIRALTVAAAPGQNVTTAVGRLSSAAEVTFSLQFYTAQSCDPAAGQPLGAPVLVTTGSSGQAYFNAELTASALPGQSVWAVTRDPRGSASAPSACVRAGPGNDSWPSALRLFPDDPSASYSAAVDDYVDLPGQSRWYKFSVQANSRLEVALTGLPANYDLTLYKDVDRAYQTLSTPADLLRLGAEFAPEAFSPEAFSPEAFSPEAFSPEAFSPEAFSPEAFSPEAFSPEAFSPEAFSPEAFSPEAFSADAYSPEAFSPEAFSPEAFSPEAFSPEAFSPEAFSSAQARSLIGISAYNGLVGEGLRVNTWDGAGDFYVRVRGRNGAFDAGAPFHLVVRQAPGECGSVSAAFPASTLAPNAGGYQTLILANLDGLEGSDAEIAVLAARLAEFAARPEVRGQVLDFAQDARFAAAHAQALAFPACPFAMNLAAGVVKEAVDAYWALNPELQYLVIVGGDAAIPFFRHPDHALLGSEKSFVPPVRDNTPSQASLKLGYVLSQDRYGARLSVSLKDDALPVPELAVGRLVETAAEAAGMLEAYLATPAGVVAAPTSAFVSGYDFLEDVAGSVQAELQAGLGPAGQVDSLIAPRDLSPADPSAWTAADLRAALLGRRHDLVFLAGHFSASGALAADYATRLTAGELAEAAVDLRNALVFSVGCHAGYNIVNAHDVPLVTREPDWAQAFAQKQAVLIAGTGYQYGDTDFIRYSEKLYELFTQELRAGSGPVAIGQALARAKQGYLAGAPVLRGIDVKAVLQATLFGLPMMSIDLPGERLARTGLPPVVLGTAPVAGNPGAALGLETYDLSVAPALAAHTVDLTNVLDPSQTSQAAYFTGPRGVAANPNEPVLPLAQYNVEAPGGKVLRGVGLRGGLYADTAGVLPFTGAPATEIRGVHAPFQSNYFFPVQTWQPNYFSALTGGDTLLNVFPVQYRSPSPTSVDATQRRFTQVDLRLFYSDHIATFSSGGADSTPALASPPAIVKVSAPVVDGQVRFQVQVVGDPAAGVQAVWVTYTGESGPLHGAWRSLDLARDPLNSTLWEGALALDGAAAGEVRFVAQAVNGVGLVSMDTNQGAYHTPGAEPAAGAPTELVFVPNAGGAVPASGRYTEQITLSALLTSGGAPLAGQPVAFILGPQSRLALSGPDGRATVTLSIYGLPGEDEVRASFAGDAAHQPAQAARPFTVERQLAQLSLSPQPAGGSPADASLLTATLSDAAGRHLGEETVFFVVTGEGQTYYEAVITDYAGRALLGALPLPPGHYTVAAYFSGQVPLAETLTLSDDRYEPAVYTGGALALLPLAAADAYQLDEDAVLVVAAPGVLANDSAAEGHPLSASLVAGPSHGTLSLAPDGGFTYAPGAEFSGSDAFTYAAGDGFAASQAVVSLQVAAVNDAPVAVPDAYTTPAGQALVVAAPGVLANDADVEGQPLAAVLASGPLHGALALNADGSFVYTPAPGFSGSDGFSYRASDGQALSAPAAVALEATAVNAPPNCGSARPSLSSLWPPNGRLLRVNIAGISDPEGDAFMLTIDRVFQDEPVGGKPDAVLWGDSVDLRAERLGGGNGRVYHIYFTATDSRGASCVAEALRVAVSHDQGGDPGAIDEGPLYDSTVAQ